MKRGIWPEKLVKKYFIYSGFYTLDIENARKNHVFILGIGLCSKVMYKQYFDCTVLPRLQKCLSFLVVQGIPSVRGNFSLT